MMPNKLTKNYLARVRHPFAALLCGCLLLPLYSNAELPADKNAQLFISSETAELNKGSGVSVFIGDVKVDHGSTHLRANKLTTYSDKDNHMIKAIALGDVNNRATYETMNDPQKPPLIAKAETIQYFPQQKYVILIGHANVTQGLDSISGQHLEYDLQKQILITKIDKNAPDKRTEIIIQPKNFSSTKP